MRLLVPVDFSDCSIAALDRAIALAETLGAHIELLHVWHPPYELAAFIGDIAGGDDAGRRESLMALLRRESQKQLDALVGRTFPRFARLTATLAAGEPREIIAARVERGDCDLVVMGTHGRTGIARLLLGSVAEWVLHHAHVPVMTVKVPHA